MRRSVTGADILHVARSSVTCLLLGLLLLIALSDAAHAVDRTRPVVRSLRLTRICLSPNGDGSGDTTALRFWVSERARFTVYVVNSRSGAIVRTLARSRYTVAGTRVVVWDGKTNSKARAPDGRYTVRLYVRDLVGHAARRYPYQLPVWVDTVKPTFRMSVGPSPFSPNARPDGVKDRTAVRFQLSQKGYVTVVITGQGKLRRFRHLLRPTGYSYVVWNGRDGFGARVPDGTYVTRTYYQDMAGNTAVLPSRSLTVDVDTTPPVVSGVRLRPAVVTPYDGDDDDDFAGVSYTLEETAAFSYSIRNPCWTRMRSASVAALSAGPHTTTWDAKQRVSSSWVVVPKGKYPIALYFTDTAGNRRAVVQWLDIRSYYLVCVDPGHGGKNGVYDSGAVGRTGLRESVVNFDIGYNHLRTLLSLVPEASVNGYPVRVLMTRTREYAPWMTLSRRSRLANVRGANIFISIHSNAAGITIAHGTETYHQSNSSRSRRLAQLVQQRVLARTGLYNRGVMSEGFHVLRRTRMPAALHEAAFISNPREERLLKTWTFRNRTALGIRDGIVAFLKEYP